MSNTIKPKNYFPLPNSAYICGLMMFKEAETQWIPLSSVLMSQDWINIEQAEKLRDIPEVREVAGIAVKIDDYTFILDGHHRAYAAYLRGDTKLKVRLMDLNKILTTQVGRHKGKDKIDLYDIKACDLQELGLID